MASCPPCFCAHIGSFSQYLPPLQFCDNWWYFLFRNRFISFLRPDNHEEHNAASGSSTSIYTGFIQDNFTDTKEPDPDLQQPRRKL